MLSFTLSFGQTHTDRKTDRWTPVKQYSPDLSMQGHKKYESFKIQ